MWNFRIDLAALKANDRNMKTSRLTLVWVLFVAAFAVAFVLIKHQIQLPATEPPQEATSDSPREPSPTPAVSARTPAAAPVEPAIESTVIEPSPEKPAPASNKLERLAQIRETFRALASGDKTNALRAAKQISDEIERETALLTLVTEWTQGELGPPRLRAERIANSGLEAGLGLELRKQPELALLWAEEMTEGAGRAAVLQGVSRFLVDSDPAAAFAMTDRLPEAERRSFTDALFADWASHDTDAALKWAEQFSDPAERDAAIRAIRTSAPVGIGTALSIQDGYPVINALMPDTPAQRSGQLQVGDRIVALAQGDSAFVDLNNLPLANIVDAIRGAPNTMLQLKIVSADAAPNAPPKTVLIMRDQIRFKTKG